MSTTSSEAEQQHQIHASADVVVIGSGAAGLMAALEAADAGSTVIVLESEGEVGGSTKLSGAYVTFCETELQPGTRDELLRDLEASHHHDHQADLSNLYVAEAARIYERISAVGVNFVRTFQFAHMTKPWAHELSGETMTGGAEIVHCLETAIRERGVEILLGLRANRLHLDGTGPQFVGVEQSGQQLLIEARRAIVIASGGFTRSQELISTFGRPGSAQIVPLTGIGSRGDGLKLGMSVGAGLSYIGVGVAPTAPTNPETTKGAMVIYAGAIALNLDGQRFVRESDVYVDVCWAGLVQREGKFFQVYDSAMRAQYAESMMGKVLTGFREIAADTLPDLVAKLEAEYAVDGAAALASIEQYNSHVRAGLDPDFGRTNTVGTAGDLQEISEGPFYATLCVPGTTHFNGGLATNDSMQVIGALGETIPHLYAAGEVTGGFHGVGYMSGTFVGFALISGSIAGRDAARTS